MGPNRRPRTGRCRFTRVVSCQRARGRLRMPSRSTTPGRRAASEGGRRSRPTKRTGRQSTSGARASRRGWVTQGDDDVRFALVEIAVEADVAFEPKPDDETVAGLLMKGERD